MLSSSVEAVDEETLHALLMHLGDVPSGAIAAAVQAAPNAPAKLETTSSPAFLSGTFSGLANECGKGDANADDDIPEYALPDAQYIERTMLPLLLRGLEVVAQVRPPDPLAFLGAYMICNNPQKPPAENGSSASAKGLEKVIPTRGSAPVDDTAPPALEEVVTQAMSRFSTSKSNTSATPKPTVTVGRGASAVTKNA
ncbi:Dpy-30 motif containing protein, putative [Leishmania guyanensis]|uniref:Dpy-30 motif containing protein n=1 Tax=Leishmania guyanensis TaxID=5670 RepID=A0A1E1IT41_LEIGU|nr:hypothetical protein BN36_1819450 [Leishmania guyanensis]